jgi:hypothetical protein
LIDTFLKEPLMTYRHALIFCLAALIWAGCSGSSNNGGSSGEGDADATSGADSDAGSEDADMISSDADAIEGDPTTDADAIEGDPATDADLSADADAGPPPGWPEGLTLIELDGAGHAEVSSTFDGASALTSLDFLSDPAVACYDNPLTTDEFFSASHVAFALAEPVGEWRDVTITVTPQSGVESNIYVVQQADNRWQVAPDITEADFCHQPISFGSPGVAQTVSFRLYAGESSNVFFGISNRGRFANDDTGTFDIEVDVTPVTGDDQCFTELDEPNQWPPYVELVSFDDEGNATLTGNINAGSPVCDLEFLDAAFCVPEIRFDSFSGNQVFYAIDGGIPDHSLLTITVTPDPGVDVNLYGVVEGTTYFYVPPNFPLTICEASLTTNRRNPGEPESITLNAINNPYNVFFAVAGDDVQGDEGGYTMSLTLINTSTDFCDDDDYAAVTGLSDWPGSVSLIELTDGMGIARGDLSEGEELCTLDWAANSSVACFPLTDRVYFDGRHQFFALSEPPPAGSNVYINVVPDDGVEVSAYAFRLGVDSYYLPPFVPSVGQCEASHNITTLDRPPNPGAIEEISFYNPTDNQYGYFIGVAGYADLILEGGYTVEVQIEEPPPPHCPDSLPGATYPTWPSTVELIDLDEEGSGSASGDLSDGSCLNLEWAENSAVACFPATRFDRYDGNHVFYALSEPIPPHSELTITVTPEDGQEVNIYGLQVGVTRFPVPPAVYSAICEASYGLSGPNPGVAETLFFNNPSDTSEYNIFFAVAGNEDTGDSGAYDIDVQLNVGVVHCEESLPGPGPGELTEWPDHVTLIGLDGEGTATQMGNLDTGVCMNLDFAAQSDVACFPATQNWHYEGNHVFYALEALMPANSEVTISVVPAPDVDVSLYGFRGGVDSFQMPPQMNGTLCEASNAWREPNPGEVETIFFSNPTDNQYRIFFAVAGNGDDGDAGAFEVQVSTLVGEGHCEETLPGDDHDSWPDEVTVVELVDNEATVDGSLSSGGCVNLEFADDSDVACWPATQDWHYQGNHQFYALADTLLPASQLTITLRPADGVDANLYGYQTGTSTFYVPPKVTSVISCEASNPWREANPGDDELIFFMNPTLSGEYQIFFGVAGNADTGTSGDYQIDLLLED